MPSAESFLEAFRRQSAAAARELLESELALHLRAAGIEFERQVIFHPSRKWRFDFAIGMQSSRPLAVEVQGGIWTGGRHSRGKGITDECEKFAHAVIAGWRVMPVTGEQVKSGKALQWIQQAIE